MKKFIRGFTLVELLIVISLLGAIAMIVIAAINPIEQANRARDTRFKSDGGQLISAIDRYFASRNEFPWQTVSPLVYGIDSSFGFVSADNEEVGLCGSDCTADGVLITTDELKTEFRSRDFVQKASSGITYSLFVGKGSETSSSVYVCYIPMAKSTRSTEVAAQKVYHIDASGGKTVTTDCDVDGADWTANGGCYVCLPE